MSKRLDTIVVGGGAAGLSAALELSHAGLTVLVVEARQRLGGRILTLHDRHSPLPIELGAEFVHGEADETFALIRAASLVVDALPNRHHWSRRGKLVKVPDFWRKIDETRRDIARRLRGKRTTDFSFAEYVEQARIPSELRKMLILFVEGYHAAHTDRISARSLAAGPEETGDESANRQFRIVSGNDALIDWLRGGLDRERVEMRLNTIATELRWRRREVILHCRSGTGARLGPFRARTAILTLPLGVLKAKTLRFVPELPAKDRAMEKLQTGQVFRIVLRFRDSFWDEELNFVHALGADVPTWWTALPAQAPLLTGWAGGPKAESLLAETEAIQIERSLASLSDLLHVRRGRIEDLLESWSMHDWQSDPYSRGAYTYVGVGGVAAQKALARPVENTLFFAGEATDPEQTATVAGALASGRRAAREVLQVLRP